MLDLCELVRVICCCLTNLAAWSSPGVSNLFDQGAKCTNFKLVGGQIEMPKVSRGKGIGCPPPQPTKGSGERRKLLQRGPGLPRQKTIFGLF